VSEVDRAEILKLLYLLKLKWNLKITEVVAHDNGVYEIKLKIKGHDGTSLLSHPSISLHPHKKCIILSGHHICKTIKSLV